MCGKNCVAIASDLRFGINQQQTTAVDMKKIYEIHPHLYVGLSGAFILITLVPVRPRSRRELHSLRTSPARVPRRPPLPRSPARRLDIDLDLELTRPRAALARQASPRMPYRSLKSLPFVTTCTNSARAAICARKRSRTS
jgi:hypothetical protein